MDLASEVFAGEAVSSLVNEAQDQQQDPELSDVKEALVGEVVEERSIGADEAPVIDKDRHFKGKEQQNCEHTPSAVDEIARGTIEPAEVPIRIPCREADVRQIDLRLTAASPLGNQLLAEGEISLLIGLEPEVGFVHLLGEPAHTFRVEVGARLE